MKVIPPKDGERRSVTLRISEETMDKVDKAAKNASISRQRLIEAILDQVLNDKKFVLRLDKRS